MAAVVATSDWLRPGMRDVNKPDRVLPPGDPDGYAQFSAARVEIEMIGGRTARAVVA